MKAIMVALMALGTIGPASAQSSDCRDMTNDVARLACYDKAAGTPLAKKAEGAAGPARQPAGSAMNASTPPTLDSLDAENRKLDQTIRNICRNC